MSNVTVFLRTALFSFGADDGHIPPGTMVLKGVIPEDTKGSTVTIEVTECLDFHGKSLSDTPIRLLLPLSKIDHMLLQRG